MQHMILLQAAGAAQGANSWSFWVMMILIFVVFYVFMILPQQKRQKKLQQEREQMKKGSKVVLSNGIFGTIKEVQETTFMIEIAKDTVVKVDKNYVFANAEDAQAQAQQQPA